MALMILTDTGHVALAQAIYASNLYLAWGDLPPFLGAPTNLTATSVATTSSLTATVYIYSVTALSANGETPPSATISITLGSNGLGVNLAWSAVSGATGYNIYGRSAGTGQKILAANVSSPSWLDIGSANLSNVNPPTSDSTSLTSWTGTPPSPLVGQKTLLRELGRRKASLVGFVKPDPINGSISTTNGRWTLTTTPTKYLYCYTAFDLSDASSSTIYQFAYFIGTVPAAGNENLLYLTPGQISDKGTMLCLENVPPIHRDNSSRETHDTVFIL